MVVTLKGPILVVEDDFDAREAMCEILVDEGYEVLSATDGRDALHVLSHQDRDRPPLLAFVDLNMPGMDGYSFIATLRRTEALAMLSIAVQSGSEDCEVPAGVQAVLRKPFDIDDILRLAQTYCG